MYGWAVRTTIRRAIRRLNDGDYGPLLANYASDAVLIFPGRNSWSGTHHGKEQIERFLQRFVGVGIKMEAHEILVNGPPWNTKVCVRFSDRATAPDGRIVYENTGVLYGRIVWGKIRLQEDFEDTEKVNDLDTYLESERPELAAFAAKEA
jgi:ketosteroid isomerase-like protein